MGNKPKGFALIMGAAGRGGFPSTSSRATSTFRILHKTVHCDRIAATHGFGASSMETSAQSKAAWSLRARRL